MSETLQESTVGSESSSLGWGARLRRVRWARWLKRFAIGALVLAVLVRLVLPFVLPGIVARVAKGQGLEVHYERLDLSILTGHVELWNVHVQPLSESGADDPSEGVRGLLGEDLTHLEFLNVDLDVSALFTGQLRAHRVEIDGLDVFARRASQASGWQWEGLPLFQPKDPAPEDPEPEGEPETEPRPFAFDLGFAVDAVRLQHLQLHIMDGAQSPPLQAKLELNVRISELGAKEQATRVEVFAHSSEFLDSLTVQAEVQLQGPKAQIESTIALHGLKGQRLAPYLQPLGLQATADNIDMECSASIQTESASEDDMAIAMRAALRNISWKADGQTAARIDAIQVEVPRYSGQAITTNDVSIRGVHAQASRNASGRLQFGGLVLMPAAQAPADAGAPAPIETQASPAPAKHADAQPMELRIPALVLEEVHLLWQDEAILPAAQVPFTLNRARLGPIQRIAGQTPPPIDLEVMMGMAGAIDSMRVQGQLQAFAPEQTATIELQADGVTLDALAPYLRSAGLESEWGGGSWQARIEARTHVDDQGVRHANAQLADIELLDGEQHLQISELSLEGLRLDSAQALTHIDQVRLAGIRGIVRRDEARTWHALGFAIVPASQAPTSAPPATDPAMQASETPGTAASSGSIADSTTESTAESTAPQTAPGSPAVPAPRFELGALIWEDTHLEIRDAALQTPVVQVFDGVSMRANGIALGRPLDPNSPEAPADFELAFSAPNLAERLALAGTLQNLAQADTPLHLQWTANLVGKGLELTAAEPWLVDLGIESHWDAASLQGAFTGSIKQTASELRAEIDVRELLFENQGVAWLQLAHIAVPEVLIAPGQVSLQPIEIDGPNMRVERNAEGQLTVAGLTFVGAPARPAPDLAAEQISQDVTPQTAAPTQESTPTRIDLPALDLSGVALRWIDAAVQPAVDLELQLQANLRDWTLGVPMEQPGTFEATVRLPGSLEELTLAGNVELVGARSAASATVRGRGMRAGSLASYLPPGLEVMLQSGELDWSLAAQIAPAEEGGQQISVLGQDLRLQESGAETPVFAWDRLALEIPRADWAGGAVEIAELAVQGMRLDAIREVDGSLNALGVRFDPNATAPDASGSTGQDLAKQDPASRDSSAQASSEDPTNNGQATPIAAHSGSRVLPKLDPEALPWIRLAALDVGIERLRFLDKNGGEPLDLGLRLHTEGPVTLLSPTPEELEPIVLRWSGAALPFARTIDSRWTLTPYAADPEFDVTMELAGIDGQAITRVLPDLKDRLDGSAWQDGRLALHSSALLRMRRRGPLAFPFQDGFGVELVVDGFALEPNASAVELAPADQDAANSNVVDLASGDLGAGDSQAPELGTLGFDSLHINIASIRPQTGDVHIKLIDWVGPHVHAWNDADGLHVGGWVWKPAPEAEPQAVASEDLEVTDAVQEEQDASDSQDAPLAHSPEPANEGSTAGPTSELRIDEIFIAGERLHFEDRSVEPVMVLPVTGWDLEAKRFSTLSLQGERPFQFRLSLYGGDVELPERTTGNLVGGLLGSVSALATGKDKFEIEKRPFFDELLVRGNLSLGQAPKGWVQARVRGLELPVFRGPANAAGVEIGDGLMDESAMVHMDGAGGLRVSSTTRFSYLSLSEPAGGPISTYLKLPAPLDSVLFALKDEDGDQTIPLNLSIGEGGASLGKILGAVSKALGTLIGEALASSPMRVLGGVTDLAGFGAKPIELTGEEWVRLPYAPGEMSEPANLQAEVEPLLELLRKDPSLILVVEQAMGAADIEQAAILANPSAELCLEMAASYRRQRKELAGQRNQIAARVRLAYATGEKVDAAGHTEALRQLDQRLATVETALDQVLERTTDRGARAQTRRTKSAALEVTRERQTLVGNALRRQPIPSMATRLDLRRPRFGAVEGEQNGFVLIAVKRRR